MRPRLAYVAALLALACDTGGGSGGAVARDSLTQRQRDSILAPSSIPGAAGGDGDAHAGVDHDHPLLADAEHPGWGEWLLGFFRPRNFVFGLSGFGLTGTLLTLFGTGAPFTLLAAAGMGAGFFAISHGVFTFLRRS